jgi:Tfp pilus assembly protein PilF
VPEEYDVDRAQALFEKTVQLDPKYPMAHHELARIYFLRNELDVAQLQIDKELEVNKHPDPASYYVRALIEGYSANYSTAEKDYEMYFKVTPANWAGINDYSWVLLKDNKPAQAHAALTWGLKNWPTNPWLLSNDATALYELGRYADAATMAKKAKPFVDELTVQDWLIAYPGNDPTLAQAGLDNFKQTTQTDLTKIFAKK